MFLENFSNITSKFCEDFQFKAGFCVYAWFIGFFGSKHTNRHFEDLTE